jgi:hypothetical protein
MNVKDSVADIQGTAIIALCYTDETLHSTYLLEELRTLLTSNNITASTRVQYVKKFRWSDCSKFQHNPIHCQKSR